MTAAIPLFMLNAEDKIAALAVKCLAVAGGYLAGYILGGIIAWAADKWALRQKTPDFIKKAIQVLLGIALAILVAMIVFGEGGGGGLLGGGGPAEGQGQGVARAPDDTNKKQSPPEKEKPPVKVQPPPAPMSSPDAPFVKVTFLGGDAARGDRLYYLGDDQTPRTFEEVKAAMDELKKKSPKDGYVLLVFPVDPKLAIDEKSRNVSRVTEEAERLGLETRRP